MTRSKGLTTQAAVMVAGAPGEVRDGLRLIVKCPVDLEKAMLP
ncbi:Hypothetical protein (plasmid) [Pseudomonas putida]|nr:Hypothetical protein [Pseudomonas putida]